MRPARGTIDLAVRGKVVRHGALVGRDTQGRDIVSGRRTPACGCRECILMTSYLLRMRVREF